MSRPEAARKYCRTCRGGIDPKSCEATECPLHKHRLRGKTEGRPADIMKHCLECCNGSKHERKMCHITDCELWLYRNGAPSRAASPLVPESIIVQHICNLVVEKSKRGRNLRKGE